jgi:hypothetical protein
MNDRDEPAGTGRSLAVGGEARAAYTLARLGTRRTVRAALALSALRAGGLGAAREAWSTPEALDAPTQIYPRLPYPELRVACIGDGSLAATSAPSEPLRAASWRTRLTVVRPDLVLIDGPGDLSAPEPLRQVVARATELDVPVVAVAEGAEAADRAELPDHVLRMPLVGKEGQQHRTPLDPWVDSRRWNPVGLDHAARGAWQLDLAVAADEQVAAARRHALVTAPLAGSGHVGHAQAVLRILASGVPVVAETTPLLQRLLHPHTALLLPADELDHVASELLRDEAGRERASVRLRRLVLTRHSASAAFERLLDAVGLERRPPTTVSVLLATRRPSKVAEALAAVDRQDLPNLDIQLVLHGIDAPIPERAVSADRGLTVHRVPDHEPLGSALNVALEAATGRLVAKMDDDDLYGPGHLRDLIVALGYSGADAVGRWSNVVYLTERNRTVHQHLERQERWASHLPGATMLVHGDVLRGLGWRRVPRGVDTELVRAIHGSGGRCYSTHRFGFVRLRHGGDHTFDRSDRGFAGEGRQEAGLDRSVLEV